MLERLSPPAGARRKRQRVGRGEGSKGKTCGRGHKGQNSRAGGGVRRGFEGGQMPINRRLPKRGFSNYLFRRDYDIVNVSSLSRFEDGTTVDPAVLVAAGLVRKGHPVKILATGEIDRKLTVRAHKFSGAAATKITAAGGTTETLEA